MRSHLGTVLPLAAVVTLACDARTASESTELVEPRHAIEIESLQRSSPARAHDVRRLIDAARPRLAACADAVRGSVGGQPNGSVATTMSLKARDGRLTSADVVLAGSRTTVDAIGGCISDVLDGKTIDIPPGLPYELTVTVHLCIQDHAPDPTT